MVAVLALLLAVADAGVAAPASAIAPTLADGGVGAAPVPEASPKGAAPAPAPTPPSALAKPFFFPTGGYAAILDHWSKRRELLRDRDVRRLEEEERQVAQLKDDLGFDNLIAIATTLVREADGARAAGANVEAMRRCKLAQDLAPSLPATAWCEARVLGVRHFSSAASACWRALQRTWADPRERRYAAGMALELFGLAVFAVCILFLTLLIVRPLGLLRHDAHHLFPRGSSEVQTSILVLLLLALPFLFSVGPLPVLCVMLLAGILYTTRTEAGLAAAALVLLALSPKVLAMSARWSASGGAAAEVYQVERGEVTRAALASLQKRVDQNSAPFAATFALARAYKRVGELTQAAALYKAALEQRPTSAEAHNNYGNVFFFLGDAKAADDHFAQAQTIDSKLLAPRFNHGTLLARGGMKTADASNVELEAVKKNDPALFDKHRDASTPSGAAANRYLADAPLPIGEWSEILATDDPSQALEIELATKLAGVFSAPLSWAIALGVALAALGLRAFQNRLFPSTRCERCGRPVCPRCEPELGTGGGQCWQCVNLFVRKGAMDPVQRARKEASVQRFRRQRALVISCAALITGAGHLLAGYPLRGLVFMLTAALLVAHALASSGVVAWPLIPRLSGAGYDGSVLLLAIVFGLSILDLFLIERKNG